MKILIKVKLLILIVLVFNSCLQSPDRSESDWTQYKFDNYRSAVSMVQLDLSSLHQCWQYSAAHAPVPAWYGPAYEDAYANSGPLPSMRDYDLAYYPIVVGDDLFYGSTSDDAIHCIDNATGKEKWVFTTNAPIHISPVYDDGKLFFGSDDGYVYCINTRNGKEIWKYSPSPENSDLVLDNGRLISYWPIRTGVMIENDHVFFGASLLPWKKSFFCAIDKNTGRDDKEFCYVREYDNMTFEGSMASTGDKIIQPQGRIAPAFFEKQTGESAGSLPGAGGCFVLVTKDEHIIHPETSRKIGLKESAKGDQPDFMSFNGGKEIIVKGDTSFVLTDNSISAYQRSTKKMLWLRRNFHAHRIIMAGDYLFAGATDTVFAISPFNGYPIWKAEVRGTVYALAAAGDALYASSDEGIIYCYRSDGISNNELVENLSKPASIDPPLTDQNVSEKLSSLKLWAGPFIETISTDKILLKFETAEALTCTVSLICNDKVVSSKTSKSSRLHEIELPVRKNFRYKGIISTENQGKLSFEYDNFFNFESPETKIPDYPTADNQRTELLESVLSGPKLGKGICLVLGSSKHRMPLEIADKSDHVIIVLDKSVRKISKLRRFLHNNSLYGCKIAAYTLSQINLQQIISNLAGMVWVENGKSFNPDDVIRLIAPRGKAVVMGIEDVDDYLKESRLSWQVDYEQSGDAVIFVKHDIEDQGEWTHEYGRADNSAFGGESLWGSTSSAEFAVQWMGRPGPRFQTDRSGRKPSPLSVSGKLFVQGKERVLALDIHNGAVLWSTAFGDFARMNIHRDCSNWVADDSCLYMAIRDKLIIVDQESGEILNINSADEKSSFDWGFISVVGDQIIGSTTPSGSHFTDYHGGAGWYDWAEGPMAEKVISKSLFVRQKGSDDNTWNYSVKGAIINSTITIYQNQIYFVESRTPNLALSDSRRGKDDLFNTVYLVSLDLASGEKNWEKKLDHHPGKTAYYMAAGNNKIVVLSSADSDFYVYTYDSDDGSLSWTDIMPWFHSNHGGHLSRPAIVGNRLIVKPGIYDLEHGNRIDYNVPKSGHGCASYALTEQSILYRGGSLTQFNFDTREFSRWERLRPDCWISSIPAQGMILSPEGGGGCSCGNWFETSMVMAPVSRAPITIERAGTEHFIDFKDETWGTYHLQYLPNQFDDDIEFEIKLKPNTNADIYYSLDGSLPNSNSLKYTEPVRIANSTEVKALVVVKTAKGERQYYRSKKFTKAKSEQ